METLNLKQAVKMSKLSADTLKDMVDSGCVRGRKGLKAYIFFEDELLEDLRKQSGNKLSRNKVTGKMVWESIRGKTVPIGTYVLKHHVDEEYAVLLKRKTKN